MIRSNPKVVNADSDGLHQLIPQKTPPASVPHPSPTTAAAAAAVAVQTAPTTLNQAIAQVTKAKAALPPPPPTGFPSPAQQAINAVKARLAPPDEHAGQVLTDPRRDANLALGVIMCNLVNYVAYMDQNPDAIASPEDRRNKGLQSHQFEGDRSLVFAGGLRYAGQDFDWQALKGAGK